MTSLTTSEATPGAVRGAVISHRIEEDEHREDEGGLLGGHPDREEVSDHPVEIDLGGCDGAGATAAAMTDAKTARAQARPLSSTSAQGPTNMRIPQKVSSLSFFRKKRQWREGRARPQTQPPQSGDERSDSLTLPANERPLPPVMSLCAEEDDLSFRREGDEFDGAGRMSSEAVRWGSIEANKSDESSRGRTSRMVYGANGNGDDDQNGCIIDDGIDGGIIDPLDAPPDPAPLTGAAAERLTASAALSLVKKRGEKVKHGLRKKMEGKGIGMNGNQNEENGVDNDRFDDSGDGESVIASSLGAVGELVPSPSGTTQERRTGLTLSILKKQHDKVKNRLRENDLKRRMEGKGFSVYANRGNDESVGDDDGSDSGKDALASSDVPGATVTPIGNANEFRTGLSLPLLKKQCGKRHLEYACLSDDDPEQKILGENLGADGDSDDESCNDDDRSEDGGGQIASPDTVGQTTGLTLSLTKKKHERVRHQLHGHTRKTPEDNTNIAEQGVRGGAPVMARPDDPPFGQFPVPLLLEDKVEEARRALSDSEYIRPSLQSISIRRNSYKMHLSDDDLGGTIVESVFFDRGSRFNDNINDDIDSDDSEEYESTAPAFVRVTNRIAQSLPLRMTNEIRTGPGLSLIKKHRRKVKHRWQSRVQAPEGQTGNVKQCNEGMERGLGSSGIFQDEPQARSNPVLETVVVSQTPCQAPGDFSDISAVLPVADELVAKSKKRRRVKPRSAYAEVYMTDKELRLDMHRPSEKLVHLRSKAMATDEDAADSQALSPSHYDGVDHRYVNPEGQGHGSDGRIGSLTVEVLSCVGLPKLGRSKLDRFSKPDVIVYLVLGDCAFATDVISSCLNPIWPSKSRRAAVFPVHHAYAQLFCGAFGVEGRKEEKNDDFAGRVVVDLAALRPGVFHDVTLPLRTSSFVYDRRPRGAVQLRFGLVWTSERKAVLSYLRPPRVGTVSGQISLPCADAKTFRNVALLVHGEHLPGKFTRRAFRATTREAALYQAQLPLLLKNLVYDAMSYANPFISLYLFAAWMHSVHQNSMGLVPCYVIGYILLLYLRNYVIFHSNQKRHGGFPPMTLSEIIQALICGSLCGSASEDKNELQRTRNHHLFLTYPVGGNIISNASELQPVDHEEFPFSDRFSYKKLSVQEALLVPKSKWTHSNEKSECMEINGKYWYYPFAVRRQGALLIEAKGTLTMNFPNPFPQCLPSSLASH